MRIDGFIPTSGTTLNTSADVLSKLKPGDTIRAQVLQNSGNELTLKLSDGSNVLASVMTPIDAADGEYVNFVYKGTIDGKPALEVASRNIQPQVDVALEDIKKTLTELKLPVTDQNIQLAQALKGQNVPVTADSMSKIINLVSKNNDLKPDSAAFLTASNMFADKNSIDKLQSLLSGRLKIGNDIGDLLRLINGDNRNSTVDVKSTVVNNLLEKLVANQINNTAVLNKTAVTASANNSTTASSATIANTTASANTSTTTVANTNANVSNANASVANTNASVANANAILADTNAILADTNASVANVNARMADTNARMADTNASVANANANVANTNTSGIENSAANLGDSAISGGSTNNSSNITQQISNLLKDGMPLGKADLPLLSSLNSQLDSMISRGGMSTEELSAAKLIAKEIGFAIFKIQGNEAASNQVNSSASSLKNFEDAVKNLQSLFVKIDQNSDEINPVKLYRNMDNALATLKNSIQQLPIGMKEAAMNIASNLESNVNFINQLNNYSSYVQIPLSIFNQNTTGELYMLKKGSKSRKLDPSKITILISLDSNNIGRIDTLLSVDKKNISTNFRLESSEIFDALKENHKPLYTSLLEKGYRLVDFTYRLMDEPLNIVNFETEAKKEFIKNPNNIDVLI